jgi:hypothetical protein
MFQNVSMVCPLDDMVVDLKIILILFSSNSQYLRAPLLLAINLDILLYLIPYGSYYIGYGRHLHLAFVLPST